MIDNKFLLRCLAGCVLAMLPGCSSTPSAPPPPPGPPLVGDVTLAVADVEPEPARQLDIGVVVFTADPVNAATAQVSPWLNEEIRAKETQYLPYVLRNTLVESNQWGAVRVLPQEDPSVDLTLSGTIVSSDGLRLVLTVQARDATGHLWLDRTYADETENRDFPVTRTSARYGVEDALPEEDPFADLYARIANDLLSVRESFSDERLANNVRVAQMRYATDLSPETFSHTLQLDADGYWEVVQLLDSSDPMLGRVADMKQRHYLFIDTVDEYYASLFEAMQPPYDLWRRYSREQILESREQRDPESGGSRNFQALSQSYDRYRWAKIFEQEFNDLALGFNNEVAPAILELNRRVRGLSGTLEEQYVQWRDILRQLFELEAYGDTRPGKIPPN